MSNEDTTEEVEEEVEVVYEEAQPFIIETGDSVKVKQVLDDAVLNAIVEAGFVPNYSWENFKLLLMFLSCVAAMTAQFYPMPFPSSRPLLATCCAAYFIISTILTVIVTFIDKDTIMFTKPKKGFEHEMRIRTNFPRFQEYFELIIQFKDPSSPCTTAKMYVGKYFTTKGEFDEDGFYLDVKRHIERFVNQKYLKFEYNHKSD